MLIWSSTSRRRRARAALAVGLAFVAACSSSSTSTAPNPSPSTHAGSTTPTTSTPPLGVTWMAGFAAPGTPAKYNKVGVIKVGSSNAKNVLVLEPGTSAGSAYFVPLAKWIVSTVPDWQVWAVERRENLLEDQTVLSSYKAGNTTSTQLYNYYLGFLKNPSIRKHFQLVPDSTVTFAKQWGLNVAIEDLHRVIDAAKSLGGKVVLGGHSLGGSVTTAYATWDFDGKPGANDLAGLVYVDGGSGPSELTAQDATSALQALNAPDATPWLAFGGIAAPFAGLYNGAGSASALLDPDSPSLGQTSGLLPANIVPPVRVTNVGQYGYALNVASSPPSLAAAQAHLGKGITAAGPVHGWDGTGALTPMTRYTTMFSGAGMSDVDGTEWYFPQRLTNDTRAVNVGNASAAQSVLGLRATMGHNLPKDLLIYAFGALGGADVTAAARLLATQSQIPASNLTLVDRQGTYAHNDPAGAYPRNDFFEQLVPFLQKIEAG